MTRGFKWHRLNDNKTLRFDNDKAGIRKAECPRCMWYGSARNFPAHWEEKRAEEETKKRGTLKT